MNDKNKTRYVLAEKTLKELADYGDVGWGGQELYRYNIDRSNLTAEEQIQQRNCSWQTRQNGRVHFSTDEELKIINQVIDKVVASKYAGDLYAKILEEVYKTKMFLCVSLNVNEENIGGLYVETYHDYSSKDKYTDGDIVLTHGKTDEFEKEVRDVKAKGGYGDNPPLVYIEEVSITYDTYSCRTVQDIPSRIKKLIKSKLVYCVKNGKLIVPEKYLDKGMAGIEEWQSIKRAGNKNNSVEKRLLRDCLRKRKVYVNDCLHRVCREIIMDQDWSMPTLTVNGMYNQGYMKKCVTHLLKGKTDNQIMQLTDDDILDMTRQYWLDKLSDTIVKLKSLTTESINKR